MNLFAADPNLARLFGIVVRDALVTFDDNGEPEFAHGLSERARAELRWSSAFALKHL